jgi:hypothetical protein
MFGNERSKKLWLFEKVDHFTAKTAKITAVHHSRRNFPWLQAFYTAITVKSASKELKSFDAKSIYWNSGKSGYCASLPCLLIDLNPLSGRHPRRQLCKQIEGQLLLRLKAQAALARVYGKITLFQFVREPAQ